MTVVRFSRHPTNGRGAHGRRMMALGNESIVTVNGHQLTHGLKKYMATSVLAVSMLFANAANAMQIPQFDKLAVDDQATYVTLLAKGSANALYAHGDRAGGDKLIQLFNTTGKTGGGAQFCPWRSEENTSELQSRQYLVCRLL